MEGQILTGRWFRVDRTLAQSPVSSFNHGDCVWFDRTLRACVRSTPVRFQRGKIATRRVWSVLIGRCPVSSHTLNIGVRGELTGASGHPAEAHNGLFFSRCYKYHIHSCVGVLLLIPTAEKHLLECQEEQGPSQVIEI